MAYILGHAVFLWAYYVPYQITITGYKILKTAYIRWLRNTETIKDPNLFYCVNYTKNDVRQFKNDLRKTKVIHIVK